MNADILIDICISGNVHSKGVTFEMKSVVYDGDVEMVCSWIISNEDMEIRWFRQSSNKTEAPFFKSEITSGKQVFTASKNFLGKIVPRDESSNAYQKLVLVNPNPQDDGLYWCQIHQQGTVHVSNKYTYRKGISSHIYIYDDVGILKQ